MYQNTYMSSDCGVPLTVIKISSETGRGLPGAEFQLTDSYGRPATRETDAWGTAVFCVFPCSVYTLEETAAPSGYVRPGRVYCVSVDRCGRISIDGVCREWLVVANKPDSVGIFPVLLFRKQNILTGQPVEGAIFTITRNGTVAGTAQSDAGGLVNFGVVEAGVYRLSEIVAPEGFQQNTAVYEVVAGADGTVTVEGIPAADFRVENAPVSDLVFRKVESETAEPVSGAVFQLSQNGEEVRRAISDANGVVDFGTISPGAYTLLEVAPPEGFQPDDTVYQVAAGTDGSIAVDGLALDGFTVENIPEEAPPVSVDFTVTKVSSEDGAPLAGAVYTLLQNGEEIDTAVSTETGSMTFAQLPPGTYELVEAAPPDGFQANQGSLPVAVGEDGTVIIEDQPAGGYLLTDVPLPPPPESELPEIERIIERAIVVQGSGIPGSEITVVFPSGQTVMVVVNTEGYWLVLVPSGEILLTGQIVRANQTEAGKLPSGYVYANVFPQV